jgi:hypothetical protein
MCVGLDDESPMRIPCFGQLCAPTRQTRVRTIVNNRDSPRFHNSVIKCILTIVLKITFSIISIFHAQIDNVKIEYTKTPFFGRVKLDTSEREAGLLSCRLKQLPTLCVPTFEFF